MTDLLNELKNECTTDSAGDGLGFTEKALIVTSALTAKSDFERLQGWLAWIIGKKVPEEMIYETILQCYLFCGYPAAIEALFRFDAVSSIELNDDFSRETRKEWTERGEALCKQVYGKNYSRLRSNFRAISPELEKWMIEEGYGKVLSRKALAGTVRELCTVASLIITGFPRQLHSHLRGAQNLGCSFRQIDETIRLMKLFVSPERYHECRELSRKILQ